MTLGNLQSALTLLLPRAAMEAKPEGRLEEKLVAGKLEVERVVETKEEAGKAAVERRWMRTKARQRHTSETLVPRKNDKRESRLS
jgi:hypothetical protein